MNWHNRYIQQAAWTRELRSYVFDKVGLFRARRVLEVGCGTGAILNEIAIAQPENIISANSADISRSAKSPDFAQGPDSSDFAMQISLYGLDLAPAALAVCRTYAPRAILTRGDVLSLPYADQTFDITYCHFLLLWVKDPLRALREMKRATASSGYVLALAEPDYTARIDRPDAMAMLGKWQNAALEKQGADIALGSRLAGMFYQAGIRIIETGAIQSRGQETLTRAEQENEWTVLEADLAGSVSRRDMRSMKRLHAQASRRGERLLNIPTYFAWGQV